VHSNPNGSAEKNRTHANLSPRKGIKILVGGAAAVKKMPATNRINLLLNTPWSSPQKFEIIPPPASGSRILHKDIK
jgi:hypothetical protein